LESRVVLDAGTGGTFLQTAGGLFSHLTSPGQVFQDGQNLAQGALDRVTQASNANGGNTALARLGTDVALVAGAALTVQNLAVPLAEAGFAFVTGAGALATTGNAPGAVASAALGVAGMGAALDITIAALGVSLVAAKDALASGPAVYNQFISQATKDLQQIEAKATNLINSVVQATQNLVQDAQKELQPPPPPINLDPDNDGDSEFDATGNVIDNT
jgi:hypothetical protein